MKIKRCLIRVAGSEEVWARALDETLFYAAELGKVDDVAQLLKHQGVDVNFAMGDGATPLGIAARNGHDDVAGLLRAMEVVQVHSIWRVAQVWLLAGRTLLRASAVRLSIMSDSNEDQEEEEEEEEAPVRAAGSEEVWARALNETLFYAAELGKVDDVALLLEHQGVDVNFAMGDGATPLLIAATEGRADVVGLLIATEGVRLNKADNHGYTPLRSAAQFGRDDIVALLLAMEGV